ncbi:MFS transporter [Nonomuraea muscovyensis]|uniref:EmrB/QacA subfamily drug resistance transporter n=1 Tax=Nonomuraea muscovyensis TaxID=1124761 RepID=A0A7X0EWY6_9ACTN|nr:MFS transporter [Nonomuraea muscovyensis]MBB6347028.1 EmrB/QacA subfamily drug resistance transporter [Nonomuraea muscovyensis]
MSSTPTTRAAAWLPLTALATAQFLVVLSTSIVNVALPQIRAGLGLSAAGLAWVVNAYVLVFGALLLLGGRSGDVFGLRRVFLAGAGLFGLASLGAALAPGAATLIAARAAQGVGAALLAPTALALVLTLFPGGRGRGAALGVWGAVSGAGGAAGVLLGGLLSDVFGWRAVFAVLVPCTLAVMAATGLLVTADRPRGGRLDVPGAVTVTAGLVALTHGLSGSWPALGAGLLLLGLFVARQRRSADPLVPGRIFTGGPVAAANALMALLGAVWLGLFFFLPLYQQRVLGYTPLEAGLTQLPLALTITLSSWVTPRLTRRLPGPAVLAGGLLLLAGGLAWLSPAPADGTFARDLLGPSLLVGAGLGVAFVQLTALSSAGVRAEDSGLAGGLVNATRQIGGAIGLAVLTVVSASQGYGGAFLSAAAVTLLTALLSLVVVRDRVVMPNRKDRL